MILTLKFSGFMLHRCEIFKNDDLFASLKHSWTFTKKATAQSIGFRWEIKEKNALKTTIQIIDLDTNEFIGETDGIDDAAISNIKIGEEIYLLSEKENAPCQYVWINGSNQEIIHYDITNIEDIVSMPFKKGRYAMSFIPDDPSKEYLILLFLGIFLLRLRVLKIGAHTLNP
jgi:hypothetical protein